MKHLISLLVFSSITFLHSTAHPESKNTIGRVGSFLSGSLVYFASGHILYNEFPGEFNEDIGWANGLFQLHLGQFISNDLVIQTMKKNIDKERPNGGGEAFPSGHAGTAFFPAWSIFHRYGINEAWPYLVGATIAGYARVHNEKHDWLDIAGSAGVTYLLSHYLIAPQDKPDQPKIGLGFDTKGVWFNFSLAW